MKLELSRQILKNLQTVKFHENPLVRAEMIHSHGQTDMAKLIVTFLNFAKAPNNASINL